MALRRQVKWHRLMAGLMMMAITLIVAAPALAVDEAMIKRMERSFSSSSVRSKPRPRPLPTCKSRWAP